MSILMTRAHKRYAVRSFIRLHRDSHAPIRGLLIELSSESARVSNLGRAEFEVGQPVAMKLESGQEISGRIRWAHNGVTGIKLDRPLHTAQLAGMVEATREYDTAELRRFGT